MGVDLRTNTNINFSAPPVESIVGDSTLLDFGSWPMKQKRRFWRLFRTAKATNDL